MTIFGGLETMELDLQIVKESDQRTQYLIFGFVRESQKLLPSDNPFSIITDLIIYTIMAFYANVERFKYASDDWKLTNDGLCATKIHDTNGRTCYGSKIISSESKQIHEWTIKIIHAEAKNIVIGIDEASHTWQGALFYLEGSTKSCCIYGYSGKKTDQKYHWKQYNQGKFGTGVTVLMILDMAKKTLSFGINGKSPTKAFDVEASNIGYCLAVSLWSKGGSMEILSYKVYQDDEK